MEVRHGGALQETLDRSRLEVAELRASRERLVMAADADRRAIERDLHEGVQQQLVALAVNLQRAGELTDPDSAAAKALLEEMERDVQQALDATAQLAERIYPPLLDAGGLAVALRAVAANIGTRVSIEVAAGVRYPPEVLRTVYLCCLDALERAGAGARPAITVREEQEALVFAVVAGSEDSVATGTRSDAGLDRLRDRVEALGGRLTVRSEPGRDTRVSGSLPLSR